MVLVWVACPRYSAATTVSCTLVSLREMETCVWGRSVVVSEGLEFGLHVCGQLVLLAHSRSSV